MQPETRSFSVHAEDDERHCRRLEGDSFEAAAFAFVADWPTSVAEVTVIVTDEADGRRQCFRIDVENGEAGPCRP